MLMEYAFLLFKFKIVDSSIRKFVEICNLMYKKIFNTMVLMISVLTLNLITSFTTSYIVHYKINLNPYKFTAIAMLVLVFILVPSYKYMSGKIEILVARVLISGPNSFGKIIGLLFSFGVVFSILFIIYLHQWFNINVFDFITVVMAK